LQVKPRGGERGHVRGGSESQSYWRGESMGAQEIPVIVLHVQVIIERPSSPPLTRIIAHVF